MRSSPTRDLLVGCFVLVGLGALAWLSLSVGGLSFNPSRGLVLYANFTQIAGLKPRAPVVIAGVKVGDVESIALGKNFEARVRLVVDPTLQLPVDTSASIVTAGLLGDRYVELQPGGDTTLLRSGEDIGFTEPAVQLERLLGKFIHQTDVGAGSEKPAEGKEKEAP
ncbi:MAG TPA: outer membrane lipid asymmetry maintenance protein MlaD [Candidatus Binatia bacterium]|nr:outer membrane lipid asymmetry maintenance protein MlaD [Candidatus Binatia bacterium]